MVSGKPKPDVVWLLNGRALPSTVPTDQYKIRSWDDGTHSIEIPNLTRDLCGVYMVKASNSLGVAHSQATLGITVEGEQVVRGVPANFVKAPPKKITVAEGGRLVLTCDVKGDPKPRGKIPFLKVAVWFHVIRIH